MLSNKLQETEKGIKSQIPRGHLDEKFKWEAHIEHLQKKLKLSIIMIKRVKKFIPKK